MTAPGSRQKASADDVQALVAQEDDLIDVVLGVGAYIKLLGEAALADLPLTLFSNRVLTRILSEPGITEPHAGPSASLSVLCRRPVADGRPERRDRLQDRMIYPLYIDGKGRYGGQTAQTFIRQVQLMERYG